MTTSPIDVFFSDRLPYLGVAAGVLFTCKVGAYRSGELATVSFVFLRVVNDVFEYRIIKLADFYTDDA